MMGKTDFYRYGPGEEVLMSKPGSDVVGLSEQYCAESFVVFDINGEGGLAADAFGLLFGNDVAIVDTANELVELLAGISEMSSEGFDRPFPNIAKGS